MVNMRKKTQDRSWDSVGPRQVFRLKVSKVLSIFINNVFLEHSYTCWYAYCL